MIYRRLYEVGAKLVLEGYRTPAPPLRACPNVGSGEISSPHSQAVENCSRDGLCGGLRNIPGLVPYQFRTVRWPTRPK
jgi:hypothetical protein